MATPKSSGRIEMFLAISEAVIEAKLATILFADSGVIAIAYQTTSTNKAVLVILKTKQNH